MLIHVYFKLYSHYIIFTRLNLKYLRSNSSIIMTVTINTTIAETTPPAIAPTLGPPLFPKALIIYIIIR